MKIFQHQTCKFNALDVGLVDRRDTAFRKMVNFACHRALVASGIPAEKLAEMNPGIAFFSLRGDENWPAKWVRETTAGHRVRPSDFEGIVHNSAPGYSSIQLHLTGPQIALVGGDIRVAADLQILAGRSRFMIVCTATPNEAAAYALEAIDE